MGKSAVCLAILIVISGPVSAAEFSGNISGFIGKKSLDDNDWENTDSQGAFGVISDFKMSNWPVSIAADAMLSVSTEEGSNSQDIDASTGAFHFGVRKIWYVPGTSFNPYLGGGIAYSTGYQKRIINDIKQDSNDSAMGAWIGTGAYWRPFKHLNTGFDLRYSQADIKLFDKEVDAGGFQGSLFIGYHW